MIVTVVRDQYAKLLLNQRPHCSILQVQPAPVLNFLLIVCRVIANLSFSFRGSLSFLVKNIFHSVFSSPSYWGDFSRHVWHYVRKDDRSVF